MKQRLVGAIVLGCLAIIFIPILLDGEGVSPPEMNTTIPVAPPFPEPLEVEAQRPEIISDTEEILVAPVEVATAEPAEVADAETEQSERPALDAEGLPQAWSIRLGIFAERANADALINRLLNQQYRAYSEAVITAQGELTAVFVGPVMTMTAAEELQAELASNFELDGLIVDFDIEDAE